MTVSDPRTPDVFVVDVAEHYTTRYLVSGNTAHDAEQIAEAFNAECGSDRGTVVACERVSTAVRRATPTDLATPGLADILTDG